MRRAVLVAVAASLALSACATTHTAGRVASPQLSYAAEPGVAVGGSAQFLVGYDDDQIYDDTADVEEWISPLDPPQRPVRLTAVQAAPVRCPPLGVLQSRGPEQSSVPLAPWQHLAAVVMCDHEGRRVPGDGVWNYTITLRATRGLLAVEKALRQRDVHELPEMTLCPTGYEGAPWIAVITTTGRVLRPRVPEGPCGGTRAAFDRATEALTWVRRDARRDDRWATEGALRRHPNAYRPCPTSMPDRLARPLPTPVGTAGIVLPPDVGERGYDIRQYLTGTGSHRGRLLVQRARSLGFGAQLDAVQSGLALVTDIRPCRARHTDVARIQNARGQWILVERDGCRRALTQDGVVAQASPDLLRAVGVRL